MKRIIPLVFLALPLFGVGCQCAELVLFANAVKTRQEWINDDYLRTVDEKERNGEYSINPDLNAQMAKDRRDNVAELRAFLDQPLKN